MENITFEQIKNAQFRLYENNPVLKHSLFSFIAADPTLLIPEESPDGKWHLFCHSFYGVDHYESLDGIDFRKTAGVVGNAQRADIKVVDSQYYLYYEKTRSTLLRLMSLFGVKWHSEIYLKKSSDLKVWSGEERVLGKSRSFEEDERGLAISNPFLLKTHEGYRLYYSCGQTFIEDCGFCEPRYISFAESKRADGDFVSRQEPVIVPDKNNPYLNLCSGCIKVYKIKDCYIGLQNGIYEEEGKSHSAIMLLRSDDGENFQFIKPLIVPEKVGDNNWMAQYVYASCLTYREGEMRIYFNARNVADTLRGRESIGFASALI